MVGTFNRRVYLWAFWGGLGVGFLPVVFAWVWILVNGTFPYTLSPAIVAALGLFVLETLLEFHVPTTETDVETVTVYRRWLVFGVVNALLWAGFALAGTWMVRRVSSRRRSDARG